MVQERPGRRVRIPDKELSNATYRPHCLSPIRDRSKAHLSSCLDPDLRMSPTDDLAPESDLVTRQRSPTSRSRRPRRPQNVPLTRHHRRRASPWRSVIPSDVPSRRSRHVPSRPGPVPSPGSDRTRRLALPDRPRPRRRRVVVVRTVLVLLTLGAFGETANLEHGPPPRQVVCVVTRLEIAYDGFEMHRTVGLQVRD